MATGDAGAAALTAGGALFVRLHQLGIQHVFVNSGTDFPPVIEGLAQAAAAGLQVPDTVIVPHEHAALGMAYGCHAVTGRAQAVMLHTNVGLANGVIGLINAATDQVPLLLMSGRTPVTEQGRFGARTVPIGWGQEMRDQAALVRESCKWDYELRFADQVGELIERAHAIATSSPPGPVYLSLPREVLCETVSVDTALGGAAMRASRAGLDADGVAQAAAWLAAAERPLVCAQRGAGSAEAMQVLARMASDWGMPVSQYWATRLAIDTDHPMHAGVDPGPWLAEADVVLVVDSLAPWWPDAHPLAAGARVIHLGPDPLFSRYPVRNFRADLALSCDTAAGLIALEAALAEHRPARQGVCATRRQRVAAVNARTREQALKAAAAGRERLDKAYVARCVSEAIDGLDASVLSELGAPLAPMTLRGHRAWYQEPFSGGLGWSLPAAMGMALADPDRLMVATLGDGSYLFANPSACHQVMEAYGIAVLVVVLNNAAWGAVRDAATGLYPHGAAARSNRVPLTSLAPSPDFTLVARASRAWACRVETADALPARLAEAIAVVRGERRTALLDVQIGA